MFLKKLSLITISLISASSAFASMNASTGFYIGGGVNYVVHKDVDNSALRSVSFGDLLLRPFIGYRFTDHVAVEAGYEDIKNDDHPASGTLGPDHYRLYAFDLAAKAIMPFDNGLSLFAKGGAAYTHQNVFNQDAVGGPVSVSTNSNRIQPLLGAGVSYQWTKKIASDLSYTQFLTSGDIGTIVLLQLGLSYTFG